MIIAITLAAIAIILNIAGRWFLLREDSALKGRIRYAIAFCPGAELVFLAMRWECARIGSPLCALSMALILPFAGEIFLQAKGQDAHAPSVARIINVLRATFTEETLKSRPGREKPVTEDALKAKKEKLADLRQYLTEWYAMLIERDGYLCSEMPEEIEHYNRYAAAYTSLLAVSKIEAAELDRLEARRVP